MAEILKCDDPKHIIMVEATIKINKFVLFLSSKNNKCFLIFAFKTTRISRFCLIKMARGSNK